LVWLEEPAVTSYSGDGGIDVRGILNAEDLSKINIAVQAKRWKGNVGPKVVRELRGSLKVHEHGIVITPSDFTASAKAEADEVGKTHGSLINGEHLVDLLIQHQVGVKQEQYTVPVLDDEYWTEILGEAEQAAVTSIFIKPQPKILLNMMKYPLPIQAEHLGQVHNAELLNIDEQVCY
jgi:restriction system protein